ncbi:hypothetical protein GURASL_25440 [Geotalea uraniireducens]|uniref:DUF2946 domain-containing protein n=1 Tax=Geotalea uraniireducens TaxID=351604 RepID=A0ABM8EM37_9BACT|nr:hypothetical protein [Geotalea uraniireducens]BDV43621.1 hypothetical protein GURASL_25440 [Geotalea uraniireducens]
MLFRCAIKYTALLLLALYLLHPAGGLAVADCGTPVLCLSATDGKEASASSTADQRDPASADDTTDGCCCDLDCPCDAAAPLPAALIPQYTPTLARLAVAEPFRAPPQVYLGKFIPPQNRS